MLFDNEYFVLLMVFDPKFKKNFFKNINTVKILEIFILKLVLNLILIWKNSKKTWWKNFLCLDGAFKIFVLFVVVFINENTTFQFFKKILEKNKKIKKFFTKIFLFLLHTLFLILKWLLYVVFIIKIYKISLFVIFFTKI